MHLAVIQSSHLLDGLGAGVGIGQFAMIGAIQGIGVGHADVDIQALRQGNVLIGTGGGDHVDGYAGVLHGGADGSAHLVVRSAGGGSTEDQAVSESRAGAGNQAQGQDQREYLFHFVFLLYFIAVQ